MTIQRRSFLAGGAAAIVGSTLSVPKIFAAAGRRAMRIEADRVLVVIQLTGGNDGLNTVIPFADDSYHRNRFATRIEAPNILKIDDYLGWHPSLAGFSEMQQAERLCVVQGVGYPNPNRSHFESMDIWHSASLSPPHRTGWIGRWCDCQSTKDSADAIPGLHLGDEPLPLAMTGLNVMVPSMKSIESLRIASDETIRNALDSIGEVDTKGELVDFLRQARQTALNAARRLESLDGSSDLPRGYPQTGLARKLAYVSKLIAIDFGPRIYYVTLGSFDTHSQQAAAHAALLSELSGAVAAFHKDLEANGRSDEVLTMCFSEFGRRVKENGSGGTDHGAAAPLFIAGGNLPRIVGKHPSLTELVDGDLEYKIDFRSVYATLLEHWLDVRSTDVLGDKFELLSLIKR